MKICPNCGKENLDKAKFCAGCSLNIKDLETLEDRIKREQKEKQLELKRKEHDEELKKWKIKREQRIEDEKRFVLQKEQYKLIHEEKKKRNFRLKIIGVLIVIIIILGVSLYFQINDFNNQTIPDLNLDNGDEHLITSDNSPKIKTVDFNGLFKMDVWEESDFNAYDTYHNSTYDWIQINSERSGNVEYVYYWEDGSISDAVSNLKDSYSNYQIEGDYVILSTDYASGTNQYCVGVQSADNDVVFIEGADLDLLKTYADSIVFA